MPAYGCAPNLPVQEPESQQASYGPYMGNEQMFMHQSGTLDTETYNWVHRFCAHTEHKKRHKTLQKFDIERDEEFAFMIHNMIGTIQRFRASWRTSPEQPLPWPMSPATVWNLLSALRHETLAWFLVEDEASWYFFFAEITGRQNRSNPLFKLLEKVLQVIEFLGPQGDQADQTSRSRHGAVFNNFQSGAVLAEEWARLGLNENPDRNDHNNFPRAGDPVWKNL